LDDASRCYPKEYFTLRAHLPFPQQAKEDSLELIRIIVRNFITDPMQALDAQLERTSGLCGRAASASPLTGRGRRR
jgi:hypothetical protein